MQSPLFSLAEKLFSCISQHSVSVLGAPACCFLLIKAEKSLACCTVVDLGAHELRIIAKLYQTIKVSASCDSEVGHFHVLRDNGVGRCGVKTDIQLKTPLMFF